MLKTISDKLFSLLPNHTNNTDRVATGSKRKRRSGECDVNDVDPDLHVSGAGKKRKTDSSNTFVDTIKTSVFNMAHWLRPNSKRYSEEFNIIPTMKRENAPTAHNGDPIKVPHLVDNRYSPNHKLGGRYNMSQYKGMTSNGTMDEEMRVGVGQNVSRQSSRSSIFQPHKPSTATMCIRLREKEEYKKLLKLQSQRSPWQQQSFGIQHISSITNDSDVISISSESSSDRNLQRACKMKVEAKPTAAIFSIPKHKMTPQISNLAYVQKSNSKSAQTKSLLATLHDQRQRYNRGISFREPAAAVHEGLNGISNRTEEDPHKAGAKIINETIKHSHVKQPETIVVIDDDDDDDSGGGSDQRTTFKSALDTNTAAPQNDTQTQKAADFRVKASFLQSKFINDKDIEDGRQARIEEQKRRKCQIEEEEMKAKAYAEKRRAQEISLDRSLKYQMRIFDDEPQVCEEIFRDEEEEEEKFPELTSEMQQVIDSALRPGPGHEVLSEEFRLQITRGDIKTLNGLNWLNDEVVNFYMNLLMKSGENGERAKLYAFNTFFYPKIKSGGHAAVKRWTKSVNIFAVHYIIIPVHLGVHWCLCVADMEKKVITYYDSMGAANNQCLHAVLQYIQDESKAKNYDAFKRNEWKLVNKEDNPQQMNAGDCGMFMCMYAEYITRGKEITFTQEHMPYFRRRMVYEIISKKLLQ